MTCRRLLIVSEPCNLWRGIPDKIFAYCEICDPYIAGDVRILFLR